MGLFDFLKERKTRATSPMSNLVELLQDGVCIANLSGELIYLNSSGFELLELPDDADLSQINFFEHIIKDTDIIEHLRGLINSEGFVTNFEVSFFTHKNHELEVIVTINFLNDFRQQTIGFLILFKDVTDFKKIQHQLLQTQKLESVGLMASGIAHDFNNILAAIIPNAELIKMTAESDSENYNRAEIIEKSALRASDIARKLLAFTRNQDQHKTTVDLNDIIKESIDLVSNSLPDSIKTELDLDDHLLKVVADSTQIQQIIMNLVFNSRDAMPGGGTITIKTIKHQIKANFQQGALSPGYYARLLFEDTGNGIPLEILPNIFDPFFTTKEIGKGTGLGLSMVYGIVKSHSGTINVRSEIGKGTQFEILLPTDETLLPEQEEEEKSFGIPKGLEVLIVDDETYVRDILGDILKFLGCKVLKAENGEKAIEIYAKENNEIDYVVIDLRMPKMDGPAAIAALERINPDLKIITTSGFDERSTELEKRKSIIGFLPKPYSLKNVSEAFESFLSNGVEK